MKINHGIHFDFPIDAYFDDPAPVPSLSQSVAKILIDRSPRHAWQAHPRLNPNFERHEPTKFDVGTIAHSLLIGRGKDICTIEVDDWRTKAAQEYREECARNGKLCVLQKHFDRATEMVVAARYQLIDAGHGHAFTPDKGDGEVAVFWQEGPTWFRSLVDWAAKSLTAFYDLKTTGMSCAPHAIAERPGELGWDIQAAFHERGLDVLDPDNAGRRKFYFVALEDQPPYALSIVEISEADATMGRKKLAMAVDIWQRCMAADRWPAYPPEVVLSRPRGWTETRWLEREAEYSGRVPINILLGG
jgi:hypothetical protein